MKPQPKSGESELWRVRLAGRVSGVVVVLGWVALSALITVGSTVGFAVLLWCTVAVIALGFWRWAFVPYVALTADGVVVQNALRRVTVAWSDISRVYPGSAGLAIYRRSGGAVIAWAVQKSNAKIWLHKRSRADFVAETIMARAASSA